MVWRKGVAYLAAAAVLGISACGGGDGPFAKDPEIDSTQMPSASPSATHTATQTATQTATPTGGMTASPSPTTTRTASPTQNPTGTITASPTGSSTASPSPTATPSPSLPPIATASPTTVPTPASTPTQTATASPTATASATAIPTLVPTASFSPSASPSPAPDVDLIATALRTGDARPLPDSAADTLLNTAADVLRNTRQTQQALLHSLIDASTFASVDFTRDSQFIPPDLSTAAAPLMVSNDGTILASISTAHGGRGVGYGANLIGQLANPGGTNEAQLPLMKRTWAWLITGDAKKALPATVRIATQNFDFPTVAKLATRLGTTAEKVVCDLSAIDNTCWQDADLLIFGQNIAGNADWQTLGSRYMAGGKGLIYVHSNWLNTNGGSKLLSSMGMRQGDYAGNYFGSADRYQITSKQTLAQQLAASDRLGGHVAAIEQLQQGRSVDFSQDKTLVNQLDNLAGDLRRFEGSGINIFADDYLQKPYLDAQRRMVLWADLYRKGVDYSQVRRSNAAQFFRTLAADSLSFAVRPAEITPQNFADWMPASAKNLAPISNWETLTVTIPQGSGRTAIGRGAIPGQVLEVEVVDAAGANLALRIGQIRTRGNPLSQENYTRPRYPDGHQVRLQSGKASKYVTAWGGALFLDYSNATAGTEVVLRIRGSVKYAHFDYSKQPNESEVQEAVAALNRADFGWQTAKFIGGEVQQTIGFAKSAIGNRTPEEYVQVRLKDMIFNSNHMANGFNNIALTAQQTQVCGDLEWDCSSNLHRQPNVQHFVGWLAACGFLCSGNPSDGAAGIAPGWGWWHELGHNTVPRYMTLTFKVGDKTVGCGTECNNNILANASAMRQYAITGGAENNNGDSINHKSFYAAIANARVTGKTGEALRQDMFDRMWVGGDDQAMRAVHFQLGFIYTRVRLGMAQPTSQDTLDFLGLLSKGNRLVDSTWTVENKNKFGMGRFENKTISNHELLYVLSSRVIGKDMRKLFAMYGIPLGDAALGSIADLGLPVQNEVYYALPRAGGNLVGQGQWLDLSQGTPVYPY